jgi:hypothetical protein
MASIRILERAFAGGELSPEMLGHIDDAKYAQGLAVCRNFIAKAQGPAENRPGTRFVREVKNSAAKTRLIPFVYSNTQTMVVELGAGYFRFHTQGETLLNGTVPYEITNPYAEADLFDIHYVQSADVMTLAHPNYPPKELRRYGATDWRLVDIELASSIDAPSWVLAEATQGTSDDGSHRYTYSYVVTVLASDQITESAASAIMSCSNNLNLTGAYNKVSWSAVAGAYRYNIYKSQGGIYGYIGQTDGLTITDDNIDPDLSKTPPIYDLVFHPNGVSSVAVSSGGTGYGTLYTGGELTAVNITNSGESYSVDTTAVIADPTGSGAHITLNVEAGTGHINSATLVSGGSNYSNPTIVFFDPTRATSPDSAGSGAEITVSMNPRYLKSVQLDVTDTTGSGASLSAIVSGGAITGVQVLNPGKNYTSPTISVSDAAGGSGVVFGSITLSGVDYPGAVSYFEQRRCFAGTSSKPQNIWMTRSGTESNMSYSLPTRDDDRIAFRVAAREANIIRHIVPLSQLLLLTGAAEWRVTSVNSDAITPSSISVRPQSYVGASNVQPCIINNSLLYCAARGGHIRELGYSWQASGFVTGDLSLRAAHLFDNYDIVDMAYSKAPQSLVWFVSSTGDLLGLTYVPDQAIGAWHRHDTDGTFESCAVVAEGSEDVLYVIVQRTINGTAKRYVERMATRQIAALEDAFFVDCGATFTAASGTTVTTISGLTWLEGKTVSVLADGAVRPQCVVSGGSITLDAPASVVQVGLPIVADLQTLPLAAAIDNSMGQGHRKAVNKVWVRVFNSSGLQAGPDSSSLTAFKPRSTEAYGTPPALETNELELMLTPQWGRNGQVWIRQSQPLPLTVVSIAAEVAIGG